MTGQQSRRTSLRGKVALITGASKRIGRALAIALALAVLVTLGALLEVRMLYQLAGAALIGCDGLWSTVRSIIVGDGKPVVSGHIAYRAVLPTPEWPKEYRINKMILWGGEKTHLVHYPLRRGDLAAAQEIGLPLTSHSGTGYEPRVSRGPGGAVINYILGAQADGCHVVCYLTMSGVLERFPRLHFVTVETGSAWLAWVMTSMDEIYEKHPMWAMPKVAMRPSDYVKRQGHVTFQNDPVGVNNRGFIGVDALFWGSDYPHPEGTWPHSQAAVEAQTRGVPEDEKRKMLGETAARLFGFDA